MKKSVILMIVIVYLASVLIVGLLGIEMFSLEEYVYVEKISYVAQGTLNEDKSTEDVKAYKGRYTQEKVAITEKGKSELGSGDAIDVYVAQFYQGEPITFELRFEVTPDAASIVKEKTRKEIFNYYASGLTVQETGEQVATLEKNDDGNAVITFVQGGTVNLLVQVNDLSTAKLYVRINVVEL